jgi:hypothetical protein
MAELANLSTQYFVVMPHYFLHFREFTCILFTLLCMAIKSFLSFDDDIIDIGEQCKLIKRFLYFFEVCLVGVLAHLGLEFADIFLCFFDLFKRKLRLMLTAVSAFTNFQDLGVNFFIYCAELFNTRLNMLAPFDLVRFNFLKAGDLCVHRTFPFKLFLESLKSVAEIKELIFLSETRKSINFLIYQLELFDESTNVLIILPRVIFVCQHILLYAIEVHAHSLLSLDHLLHSLLEVVLTVA